MVLVVDSICRDSVNMYVMYDNTTKQMLREVRRDSRTTKKQAQASSKVCDSFFTTLKSYEVLETSHSRAMASFAMPFSSIVHMRTKHLVTKYNHHSRSLN